MDKGNRTLKQILKEYFRNMLIGIIYFTIAYGALKPANLPKDWYYIFCFATALWGITTIDFIEEENDNFYFAGAIVLAIFFVGYWIDKLL